MTAPLNEPCKKFFMEMKDNAAVKADPMLAEYVKSINYKINNPPNMFKVRYNSSLEHDYIYFTKHCALSGIGLDELDKLKNEFNLPWLRTWMETPFIRSANGRSRGGRRKSRRTRRARKSCKSHRHH